MYEAPSLEEWNEVRCKGILTTWGCLMKIVVRRMKSGTV